MKILITGINGFLGRHFAAHALDLGHQVGGLVRRPVQLPAVLSLCPLWQVGEHIPNQPDTTLNQAFTEFAPDVVVHIAALYIAEHKANDVVPLIRANVEYGARLLEAMQQAQCQALVYAGTSWQHYHNQTYCPVNLYAATKEAFSNLAAYYLDAADLRMLEIHLYDSYGEDDERARLLNVLARSSRTGEEIRMSAGAPRMHLLHVEDLARGFLIACEQTLALSKGEKRIYRLPSAEALSLREIVALCHKVWPDKPPRVQWDALPYRARQVFEPWEDAPILPHWHAQISLEEGLQRLRNNIT